MRTEGRCGSEGDRGARFGSPDSENNTTDCLKEEAAPPGISPEFKEISFTKCLRKPGNKYLEVLCI